MVVSWTTKVAEGWKETDQIKEAGEGGGFVWGGLGGGEKMQTTVIEQQLK